MYLNLKTPTSLCLLVTLTLLSGCVKNHAKQAELDVFAAISLTDALTELAAAFRAERHVRIYYNFAASTTLQRQLEHGASADIFISASPHQMIALETTDLLEPKTRRDLLTNQLVIIGHKSTVLDIGTPDVLTARTISRIAIGHPDIVPAGTYAKEAFTQLGLWEILHPKLIFGADVRATLAYVASGNVDVGVVYKTDALLSTDIKVLYQLPPKTYTRIVYPAAVMKRSVRKSLASAFIAYLHSGASTEIFQKHGFTVLVP